MIMTGKQLIDLGIVRGAPPYKVDDDNLPSYGQDGCGVTLRGAFLEAQLGYHFKDIDHGQAIAVPTIETIHMPTNLVGTLYIKSTLMRQGWFLSSAIIDPGYVGALTIRMFNGSGRTLPIWIHGGIVMFVAQRLNEAVPAYEGRWQNA